MRFENFIRFIDYFGYGRKLKLAGFAVLAFFAGCLEFIGIALIYPFILMIIKPETVTGLNAYVKFSAFTGVTSPVINALILGGLALVVFIFKNLYMIFFLRLQSNFLINWKIDIVNSFMKYFLFGSYKEIIKCSNADKYYILNSLSQQVLSTFVMRILTLFTNTVIVFMVISLIMFKFPLAGVVTIVFAVVTMLIQNKLLKNAAASIYSKIQQESKILNEYSCCNVENLKDIKMISAEADFYAKYVQKHKIVADLNADNEFYSGIPPFIVETLIVFSLLIMGMFIAFSNLNNQSAMVASFALVVASIFRIAPALNRIQTSIINIGIGRTYLKALLNYYESFGMKNFHPVMSNETIDLKFNHQIEIKNIHFSYNEGKEVLKNITFEIKKGDFIGIVGLSGSGKTTLADILMGLLPPDCGEISVDGLKLTPKNYHNFRNIIGYVPQDVRILEQSLTENIAWGICPDEIDMEKIKAVIHDVKLDDFVNQFENGLESAVFVGGHGASQGQKQRIALARALFRNPQILILDEATSSLDVKVEHEITDMLNSLSDKKTIIAIAHRLSTLKSCNKIIYMKAGKIVDIGTFAELSAKYEDFETLLKLSSIN